MTRRMRACVCALEVRKPACQPVSEIAESYGMSESKVKVTLLRTRKKLRKFLKEEELL